VIAKSLDEGVQSKVVVVAVVVLKILVLKHLIPFY